MLASACDKQDLAPHSVESLNTGSEADFQSVFFLNEDTGFIAGGERYTESIIYRTVDAGESWQLLDTGLGVGIFDIDFFNDSLGLAVAYGGLIARTTNLGESWQLINLGFPPDSYMPLRAVQFIDQQHVVAVGGVGYDKGAIARSSDGGVNWTVHFSDTIEYRALDLMGERLLLAGFGEVHESIDRGESWQQYRVDGDYFSSVSTVQQQVYVCGVFGSIYRSGIDDTDTWTTLRDGNKLLQKRWEMECIASFSDPEQVYLAGRDLFKFSKDGGENWANIGDQNRSLNDIFLLDDDGGYAVGNDGSVLRFKTQ